MLQGGIVWKFPVVESSIIKVAAMVYGCRSPFLGIGRRPGQVVVSVDVEGITCLFKNIPFSTAPRFRSCK